MVLQATLVGITTGELPSLGDASKRDRSQLVCYLDNLPTIGLLWETGALPQQSSHDKPRPNHLLPYLTKIRLKRSNQSLTGALNVPGSSVAEHIPLTQMLGLVSNDQADLYWIFSFSLKRT